MSCGTDKANMYHQVGIYTGNILKGTKPAVLITRYPGPGAIHISQTLYFRAPVKIGDTVVERVAIRPRALPRRLARRATGFLNTLRFME